MRKQTEQRGTTSDSMTPWLANDGFSGAEKMGL